MRPVIPAIFDIFGGNLMIHFSISRILESITRKFCHILINIRGGERLTEIFRRRMVNRYGGSNKKTITINDFDGDLRLCLDRDSYIDSKIYIRGWHSMLELKCLDLFLTPETIFIDVGAYIGEFTIFSAKRCSNGKILSFEPDNNNYQRLIYNIKLNAFENIVPFNCGLSDEKTNAQLYTSRKIREDGVRSCVTTMFPRSVDYVPIGISNTNSIDQVYQNNRYRGLDVIKIDTEGAELAVLNGAKRTIANYRPVIMIEINEIMLRAAGHTKHEVGKTLLDWNYKPYRINRLGKPVKYQAGELPDFCNIIYFPCTS